MKLSAKKLLLADGIGAVVTALILTLVLAPYQPVFGMPTKILYPLAAVAGMFALYSFTSSFLIRQRWKPVMNRIAFANIFYCCLTILLVILFYDQLTLPGVLYFFAEVVVISILARLEWRCAKSLDP
jgi:hypothetical protein